MNIASLRNATASTVDRIATWSEVKLLVGFIICCTVTMYILGSTERYSKDPENLLTNASLADGLNGWSIAGKQQMLSRSGTEIRLTPVGEVTYVKIFQTLTADHELYRVTGQLRVSGTSASEQKRYAGIGMTLRGNATRYNHTPIIRFAGAHDWFEIDETFPVASTFDSVEFGVTSLGDGFDIQLRNIELNSVTLMPGFRIISWFLLTWVLLFSTFVTLVLLIKLWRRLGPVRFCLLVPLLVLFILLVMYFGLSSNKSLGNAIQDSSLLPPNVLEQAKPWAAFVLQQPVVNADSVVAKLMHFAFFLIFGFVAGLVVLFNRSTVALLCGIALAVFTEILQIFFVTRTGSLRDVGLNLAGLLAGVLILLFFYSLFRLIGDRLRGKSTGG